MTKQLFFPLNSTREMLLVWLYSSGFLSATVAGSFVQPAFVALFVAFVVHIPAGYVTCSSSYQLKRLIVCRSHWVTCVSVLTASAHVSQAGRSGWVGLVFCFKDVHDTTIRHSFCDVKKYKTLCLFSLNSSWLIRSRIGIVVMTLSWVGWKKATGIASASRPMKRVAKNPRGFSKCFSSLLND